MHPGLKTRKGTIKHYSRVLDQSKQVLRFILLLVADAKRHDDQSVQVHKCRLICAFFVCIISFRNIYFESKNVDIFLSVSYNIYVLGARKNRLFRVPTTYDLVKK